MKMIFLMILIYLSLIESSSAEELYPKSVKAGNFHNCMLFSNDQLKCWGANYHGQLGHNKSQEIGNLPDQMGSHLDFLPFKVSHFALGFYHTCIITKTNNLECWGSLKESLNISDEVSSNGGVLKLVAGYGYSCVLFQSGNLKCWGFESRGRLGTENSSDKVSYSEAKYAMFPGRIIDVAAYFNTCVLTDVNDAYCIGDNEMGSLGQGKEAAYLLATEVQPIRHGSSVKIAQVHAGYNRNCLSFLDGTLKCFGLNENGALGIESSIPNIGLSYDDMGENLKAALGPSSGNVKIQTKSKTTCALYEKTGVLKCFGSNSHRQLGLSHNTSIGSTPGSMGNNLGSVDIGELGRVVDFSLGSTYVCAVVRYGNDLNPENLKVKCWGEGTFGALGRHDLVNYENDFELTPSTIPPVELL